MSTGSVRRLLEIRAQACAPSPSRGRRDVAPRVVAHVAARHAMRRVPYPVAIPGYPSDYPDTRVGWWHESQRSCHSSRSDFGVGFRGRAQSLTRVYSHLPRGRAPCLARYLGYPRPGTRVTHPGIVPGVPGHTRRRSLAHARARAQVAIDRFSSFFPMIFTDSFWH